MESPQQDKDHSSWPVTVVVVAALAGGLWIYQGPLKSSRPIDAGLQLPAGGERVQARLWEDPFRAVETHVKSERADGATAPHHGLGQLAVEIADRVAELQGSERRAGAAGDRAPRAAGPPLTILLAMVDGSPYSEGSESRTRSRYALVSALGVAGYFPRDGEHIRYAVAPLRRAGPAQTAHPPCERSPQATGGTACGAPPAQEPASGATIPYEWFHRAAAPGHDRDVVVLWVKDQDISGRPLTALAGLIRLLGPGYGGNGARPATPRFKIIGPRGSGTLQSMVADLDAGNEVLASQAEWVGEVAIHSPWATAADAVLAGPSGGGSEEAASKAGGPSLSLARIFAEKRRQRQTGFVFAREIGSDAVLAQALIEELCRRGVLVQEHPIALVSELDTSYGRALPLTFAAVAQHKRAGSDCRAFDFGPHTSAGDYAKTPAFRADLARLENDAGWIKHTRQQRGIKMVRYSYLRGLDGERPPDERSRERRDSASGDDAPRSPNQVIMQDVKKLARPEGQSQFDYLRRLADRIETEQPGLTAIGVLGSDVYDKLLIMQALQPRFPGAIFFTTDLDTRLLHQDEYAWTRNLLIGSHYGLELAPAIQGGVPPFRWSYQTALYFATLRAIGHVEREARRGSYRVHVTDPPPTFSADRPPKVYEVGRTGALDLSVEPATSDGNPRIHAPRAAHHPSAIGLLGFGLILFLGLVVLSFFSRTIAQQLGRTAALLALAGASFWWLVSDPAGEPFYWLQGVSIWPTELLRLVAFVLAIAFLCVITRTLGASNAALGRSFPPPRASRAARRDCGPRPARLVRMGLRRSFAVWRSRVLPARRRQPSVRRRALDLPRLWHAYVQLGHPARRWGRVLPQAFVYIVFGILLFLSLGFPSTPYRRVASLVVDKVVLVLSVGAFILLIFFVADATVLCTRFIEHMARGATRAMAPPDQWTRIIALIAGRTQVVDRLIYYPVIVLLVLFASRVTVFDRWDFPPALLIIMGANFAIALICLLMLRRAAMRAKRLALEDLRHLAPAPAGCGLGPSRATIDAAIRKIESTKDGAFVPLARHPVLGAIVYPFGGIGILALLEFLSLNY